MDQCKVLNRALWIQRLDSQSLLTAPPAAILTVSGRDYVDRPTHEFGAELDCRVFPGACFNTPVARSNGTISLRLIQISDADETALTIPAGTCGRD